MSFNVCLCVEFLNNCVCQDIFGFMCVRFSICLRWNIFIYVWMCLCIYVFLSVQVWQEREREVPGGQFSCLRECCYFFPQFIIIISCKQIVTYSVVKLTLLSFKHWQAKCHKRRRLQFFNVLSMLFLKTDFSTLFSYPFRIEQDYLQDKCIWDKLLRDKQ